jgi:hypothetical protein
MGSFHLAFIESRITVNRSKKVRAAMQALSNSVGSEIPQITPVYGFQVAVHPAVLGFGRSTFRSDGTEMPFKSRGFFGGFFMF